MANEVAMGRKSSTRVGLSNLAQRIRNELPAYPDGSPERANALTTLRNIRYVLARRDFMP
jgi:hypothetical protein